MSPNDISLYSAMQNISLVQLMVEKKRHFRHDSEFAAFVKAQLKRLQKRKTVSAGTVKYFNKVLEPQKSGFARRWLQRLNRYAEIQKSLSALKQMTDAERLALFFTSMQKLGYAVQPDHGDDLHFDDTQSQQVLKMGFVGMANSQICKFEQGNLCQDTYLTYYLPADQDMAEGVLLKYLQSFGFNIQLPVNRASSRLARNVFAHIPIVSFARQMQ
ncbi:hypothetical protein [Lacimicrobium alkaliphilum]|uniref:Homing endonuclease LAGLIDADG domain-containing protein n=1 Tax=Lacimicrobium alkaliphilum TaxID=1526571 RepID=A0ABQ1REN7_9ALTE|nr:hypothetical protein [Lacimicrobium alkaliphilum]GGD65500.1 hypothetical protein GCM10011357_20970 [Lacimicrobium alkaliphilum]